MTTHDDAPRLWLHEEVLLVCLDDEKGTVGLESNADIALGGAVLSELVVAGRVTVEEGAKKPMCAVVDGSPTGNAMLDACLAMMVESKKQRSASDWVWQFAHLKDRYDLAAAGLIEMGALRREEGKILFFFPTMRYPEANHAIEAGVIDRIKDAVVGAGPVEDDRTAMVVSILYAAGMLSLVMAKREIKAQKARLEEIARGDIAAAAVKTVVETIRTAVIAAMVVATTVAAS